MNLLDRSIGRPKIDRVRRALRAQAGLFGQFIPRQFLQMDLSGFAPTLGVSKPAHQLKMFPSDTRWD